MGEGEVIVWTLGEDQPFPSKIFVVSGPSGAGKTSLCAEVLRRFPRLLESVSHTTRAPRPGEQNGKDYFFVDRATFEQMIREGRFLEWAEVHGYLYGSSFDRLKACSAEKDLLFELDCRGAKQLRERIQGAVLIFVMTPSFSDLVSRIQRRGEICREDLSVRIRTARQEIQQVSFFDYLVINDNFADAVDQIGSILVSERCRKDLRAGFWVDKWSREFECLLGKPV